jgi:deoxyribodipyrimidine photo-lyase
MINKKRIRKLNKFEFVPQEKGNVLYWMDREMRLNDNWALLTAQEIAKTNNQNLVVIYNLIPSFLGGTLRQLDFKIKSLQELEIEFKKKNIPFFVLVEEKGTGKNQENETVNQILNFINKNNISAVVTDFSPLKIQMNWTKEIARKIKIPFYEVDAHNIVPAWITSNKQEFAAYNIRPKIKRLLSEFLTKFPALQKMSENNLKNKYLVTKTDLDFVLKNAEIDREVLPVDWIIPSEKAGLKAVANFIKNRFANYDEKRNNPTENFQSNLSPYLHYGNISPARVALEIFKAENFDLKDLANLKPEIKMGLNLKGLSKNADAFLEELIFRKELADNYCFYNSNYDNSKGFPDWAIKTLNSVKDDKREYLYTKKEFENAKTHDDLWNAAQMEMIKTGKMHGYMRMYWAKKILEWTKTVEEAQKIAIYLNDKYEIDGRDPNGYVGIAWSIGGLHDRAWFKRPIFGQIRYMSFNGLKSKFDVKAYIEKWLD